jgi:hypothetical protein
MCDLPQICVCVCVCLCVCVCVYMYGPEDDPVGSEHVALVMCLIVNKIYSVRQNLSLPCNFTLESPESACVAFIAIL